MYCRVRSYAYGHPDKPANQIAIVSNVEVTSGKRKYVCDDGEQRSWNLNFNVIKKAKLSFKTHE